MFLAAFSRSLSHVPQFCERVQLDSIVYNELGHPDDLISEGSGDVDEFKSLPRYANTDVPTTKDSKIKPNNF